MVERYPGVPQVTATHAFLLRRNGLGDAADALLREALGVHPEDPVLHAQLGELRLEENDKLEARALFEAALAKEAEFPRALMGLARLAESAGDPATAVRLYQRVLAQGARVGTLYGAAFSRLRALRDTPAPVGP